MKAGRLSPLHTGRLYRPQGQPWYPFLLESRSTLSEIEPPTFQLVAQCLNQLRHCVPLRMCVHVPITFLPFEYGLTTLVLLPGYVQPTRGPVSGNTLSGVNGFHLPSLHLALQMSLAVPYTIKLCFYGSNVYEHRNDVLCMNLNVPFKKLV